MAVAITSEKERKRFQEFIDKLNIESNEAKRNIISLQAQSVSDQLEQLRVDYRELLNEFEDRFIPIFELIEQKIEFINLEAGTIQKTLQQRILKDKKERRDDLILQCILNHARQNYEIHKLFLSQNKNQFGKQEPQKLLKEAGIIYFNETQQCRAYIERWLNSQSR